MFKAIVDDVRAQFAQGNRVTRLVIYNTAIFIALNLVRVFFVLLSGFETGGGFESQFLKYFVLSSDLLFDATHPWVFITHMFVHLGFWHFLFNMLYLFWFGRILGDFLGDHRIYPIYLLGGFAGALCYLIAAPLIGTSSIAYGASAAVMAIATAAGSIAPNYTLRLLFIGDVKLKYIVLVLVLLDIFALGSMANFGGHVAHLGGAALGLLFVSMLKNGTDLSEPVNRLLGWFKSLYTETPSTARKHKSGGLKVRSKRRPRGTSRTDNSSQNPDFQSRIDAILDKIKASGYDSLTDEEKEFLFQASKK